MSCYISKYDPAAYVLPALSFIKRVYREFMRNPARHQHSPECLNALDSFQFADEVACAVRVRSSAGQSSDALWSSRHVIAVVKT